MQVCRRQNLFIGNILRCHTGSPDVKHVPAPLQLVTQTNNMCVQGQTECVLISEGFWEDRHLITASKWKWKPEDEAGTFVRLFQRLSHNTDAILCSIFPVWPVNAWLCSHLFSVRPKVPQSTLIISVRNVRRVYSWNRCLPSTGKPGTLPWVLGRYQIKLLHTVFRGRFANLSVLAGEICVASPLEKEGKMSYYPCGI